MKLFLFWVATIVTTSQALYPAVAQTTAKSPIERIEAPAQPGAIPLYAEKIPTDGGEQWGRFGGQPMVRNVSRPTLTPFLPDPAKATGAAVIVAPGGAFKVLSMENEGWSVARWLADQGVAAFVLKYRLNPTPQDDAAFLREIMTAMSAIASSGGKLPNIEEPRATDDAIAALKLVRSNSAKWAVDPNRVGMIGFSAGAITTLNAVLQSPGNERPAFIGYIYGPMLKVAVPAEAPPMFAALAIDDELFGAQGYGIIEAWRAAKRPVELHAYERGGHGFGMGKAGTTTIELMPQFLAWLQARGLLAGELQP